MKKLFTLIAVLGIVLTFQSCDEAIASTLEGTWEGRMYITEYYNNHTYTSTDTKICFLKNPFKFTSGKGYWVDYYSDAPWDYVANHIEWKVNNQIIYIHFVEEDTDMEIHDYKLNDDHFVGRIYEGNTQVEFSLVHTSSPNWDNFNWGFEDYYSKSFKGENKAKPVRGLQAPAEK